MAMNIRARAPGVEVKTGFMSGRIATIFQGSDLSEDFNAWEASKDAPGVIDQATC